jgi:hypothetical protein
VEICRAFEKWCVRFRREKDVTSSGSCLQVKAISGKIENEAWDVHRSARAGDTDYGESSVGSMCFGASGVLGRCACALEQDTRNDVLRRAGEAGER